MGKALRRQIRTQKLIPILEKFSVTGVCALKNHFDVAIVGAGMLGVAHAWAAARAGLSVIMFERSEQAHGATVRNFGQVLVTGQPPGDMHTLARRTRELWLELADECGFHVRRNGCLILSRQPLESAVLEEFAHERATEQEYNVDLVTHASLRSLFGGRFSHHDMALIGKDDLQIYSRQALPAITAHLQRMGITIRTSTLVQSIEEQSLVTTSGRFSADKIFVCPGHDYQTLCHDILSAMDLQIVRLQMLRLRMTHNAFALDRPVLTGLSLIHYGAFSDLSSAKTLRHHLQETEPFLMDNGIHLLISPTPDGDLIVGDSHHYGKDASAFGDEQIDEAFIELAQMVLNTKLGVLSRWQGVYGARGPAPYSILTPRKGLTISVMHSGVGMTTGLAIGERAVQASLADA